ncbi:MAG: hypothetical protein IT565_03930 [Rhodospirillales bacterium]|nr:hypothetical protein [Rhodospirillales bacterium]
MFEFLKAKKPAPKPAAKPPVKARLANGAKPKPVVALPPEGEATGRSEEDRRRSMLVRQLRLSLIKSLDKPEGRKAIVKALQRMMHRDEKTAP